MPHMDKLSNHRTTWFDNGSFGGVTYIHTNIVTWKDGVVTLDSGGWETVTTKRKMNQASNQFGLGFKVYQRDYKWFVDTPDAAGIPFSDGMQFKVKAYA